MSTKLIRQRFVRTLPSQTLVPQSRLALLPMFQPGVPVRHSGAGAWRTLFRLPGLCCLGLFLALANRGQAQPLNNNFAAAWTLVGASVSTNGNSANATKETGEPNHAGNAGARSVWFNWTAPREAQ